MKTAAIQFDLFEKILPPDTPLGNYALSAKPPPISADPVEAAIAEHRAMWARHPAWTVSTRPDDPPIRSVYKWPNIDRQDTVVWVWRTAGAKFPDAILHITLIGPDGEQWGESGRVAENIAARIKAAGNHQPQANERSKP
jgi:hypothetical protein